MRIVNMIGGLGNQMFQYAFALMLRHRYPDEQVMVDTHHYHSLLFRKIGSVNLHNGYELNRLFAHANLPVAQRKDLRRVTRYIPNYALSRIARRLLPPLKTEYVATRQEDFCRYEQVFRDGDTYYEGYWQSIAWMEGMEKELRHTFTPSAPNEYNRQIICDMESSDSVGIHIRRGDYKYDPEFNGICTTDYYQKAISQVLADGRQRTFYIFSNDIEWCKEALPAYLGNNKAVFVDGNRGADSYRDMFLMAHCRELIIANSTFSWWGAYLNDRIHAVYAPTPWLRRDCDINIYPSQWVRIQV